MAVKKEDLEEITEYIKKHLSEWILFPASLGY